MPAESTAVLLRRAATHLDELAKGATPGPWRTAMVEGIFYVASAKHGPVTMDNDGPVCACIADDGGVAIERDEAEGGRADAEWMATMSPVVAAPLAAWLRETADYVAAVQCSPPAGAVALARALLGELRLLRDHGGPDFTTDGPPLMAQAMREADTATAASTEA